VLIYYFVTFARDARILTRRIPVAA
jgi:hypothetical protein